MELSKDQQKAHDLVIDNITPPIYKRVIKVAGYAGTGKTTLLVSLRKTIYKKNPNLRIAFATFTGRASAVLREKLVAANCEYPGDYVGTIHRLIYIPMYKFDPKSGRKIITGWRKTNFINFDFIIIDEASMVDYEMFRDLLHFDLPMIVVGDHGQLPPINSNHSLVLDDPDFVLEKIHRQAEGNPIIKLSQIVRDYGIIRTGIYSPGVFKIPYAEKKCKELIDGVNHLDPATIVLCGMNKTRVAFTEKIRKKHEFSRPEPYPGERLICLRNNYNDKIMNGQIGTLLWLMYENEEIYDITLLMDGFPDPFQTLAFPPTFGLEKYDEVFSNMDWKDLQEVSGNKSVNFFDFGYVVSVHRSQGSEFDKVILLEERSYYWDDEYYKKWLYTAVTRAREKLFVVEF
jgi:exodeoxyribonuclease-5